MRKVKTKLEALKAVIAGKRVRLPKDQPGSYCALYRDQPSWFVDSDEQGPLTDELNHHKEYIVEEDTPPIRIAGEVVYETQTGISVGCKEISRAELVAIMPLLEKIVAKKQKRKKKARARKKVAV